MALVPDTCYICGKPLKEGDEGRVLTIGVVREEHPDLGKVAFSQREVMTCEDHI